MTGKILVLTAIDDELDNARAPAGVEVIYSGVGKVNAASGATLSLLVLRPTLVINYGTAGRINAALSGLVEVAHVVQRDMIAMPLVPRGRTPYSSNLDRLSSGFDGVTCGTGDSFVTSDDPWLTENNVDVVDMELFAIAHVCQRHSIPWRAFKFITDDDHWTANVGSGQDLFWDAMKKLSN
jgi:adenosylhomocysteine nucleosidase